MSNRSKGGADPGSTNQRKRSVGGQSELTESNSPKMLQSEVSDRAPAVTHKKVSESLFQSELAVVHKRSVSRCLTRQGHR